MLARLLDEQLDEADHASIADHVESCVACQERLKQLTGDDSRLLTSGAERSIVNQFRLTDDARELRFEPRQFRTNNRFSMMAATRNSARPRKRPSITATTPMPGTANRYLASAPATPSFRRFRVMRSWQSLVTAAWASSIRRTSTD